MTGQKDRYTTTEKLWKLDDDTLKTPKHDEMVLWLLNKENVNSILPYKIGYEIQFNPNVNNNSTQNNYRFSQKLFGNVLNVWAALNQKLDHRLDVQGIFKDEYDIIWSEMIEDFHKCDCYEIGTHSVNIKSEMPITANNGFLVGYCDIVISLRLPELYNGNYFKIIYKPQYDNSVKYIEVKPTIKSFGETLRQLNTYKHYLPGGDMYLFTTDLRFKEAFESQGIKVLTYPTQ